MESLKEQQGAIKDMSSDYGKKGAIIGRMCVVES